MRDPRYVIQISVRVLDILNGGMVLVPPNSPLSTNLYVEAGEVVDLLWGYCGYSKIKKEIPNLRHSISLSTINISFRRGRTVRSK